MHVSATPTHTDDGKVREIDDWQPRANLSKLFNEGSISFDQEDLITQFSETFYEKRDYAVDYVQHLTNLRHSKEIRAAQRAKDGPGCQGGTENFKPFLILVALILLLYCSVPAFRAHVCT